MIVEATKFTSELTLPPQVGRARQILIKPCAGSPQPYPVSTSREILEVLISRILQMGDVSIILLEGCPQGDSMRPIYHALSYDFPHVVVQDVRDCVLVEVENPLPRPFTLSAFWLPNVVLYCDYLITVSPLKICGRRGSLTIENLLSLLPVSKYGRDSLTGWGALQNLGLHKVIADLYFTLPFDLGIIDARSKFISKDGSAAGAVEDYNKFFVGEPYEVDREASETMGLETKYLQLIEAGKAQLKSQMSRG